MAAVEITISGVLYDKYNRTQQNVVLFGEASITGLQIGGGPMPPGGGPSLPPWWPGHPEHPIPPTVWPQPPGGGQPQPPWWPGHPEHPIPPTVWPQPPTEKPPEPIQPPVEWKAVWHPTEGWIVVGIPTGEHVTPSK
jgi:hypothetical protein